MHYWWELKKILIFYFAFTLPFYFLFFLHFILRVSLLIASPSLLSSSTDPSLRRWSHKPSRHRPFRLALHSFRFDREWPSHAVGGEIKQSVSVRAQFIGEDHETVPLGAGLVSRYQNGQGIGHGFRFGCVDFLGFCFVLLHWFWWARQGCGCAMIFMGLTVVVAVCWWLNEILFYYNVYIILLC